MSCENDFFYFTGIKFECITDCDANMTTIQYGDEINEFKITGTIMTTATVVKCEIVESYLS